MAAVENYLGILLCLAYHRVGPAHLFVELGNWNSAWSFPQSIPLIEFRTCGVGLWWGHHRSHLLSTSVNLFEVWIMILYLIRASKMHYSLQEWICLLFKWQNGVHSEICPGRSGYDSAEHSAGSFRWGEVRQVEPSQGEVGHWVRRWHHQDLGQCFLHPDCFWVFYEGVCLCSLALVWMTVSRFCQPMDLCLLCALTA